MQALHPLQRGNQRYNFITEYKQISTWSLTIHRAMPQGQLLVYDTIDLQVHMYETRHKAQCVCVCGGGGFSWFDNYTWAHSIIHCVT